MKKKLIIGLLRCVLEPVLSCAQDGHALQAELTQIAEAINVEEKEVFSANSPNLDWLFEPDTLATSEYSIAIAEWNRHALNDDLGIKIIGSADHYFGQGFDNETGRFDRQRLSVGLSWDLYDQGWRNNRINSKIYKNKADILRLNGQQDAMTAAYGLHFNAIIYLFNKEKIRFLASYKTHLGQILPTYQKLYLKHIIPFSQVLEIKKKTEKVALLIRSYSDFNLAFEASYGSHWRLYSSDQFPVFALTISDLLQGQEIPGRLEAIRKIENQNIALKNQNKSDIKISLYAKANFATGQSQGQNGHYQSAGIRVSVPIASLYTKHQSLSELEIIENNNRHDLLARAHIKEIMVEHYEYEDQLQKYVSLRYEQLKLKERLRQKRVVLQLDSSRSSVAQAILLAQEYKDVTYEMICTKQLLYLGLLKIQQRLGEASVIDYCSPYQFQHENKLKGKRYYKVSKSDLGEFKADFIMNYLINNECKAVIDTGLTAHFVEKLKSKGISIIDQIPENTILINPNHFLDRVAIENYIGSAISPDQTVVFANLTEMIKIENRTINTLSP